MDLPPADFTDLVCRTIERFSANGPASRNIAFAAGVAARPPSPPRGAEIFYLRKNGRVAPSVKGKEITDAVMMTWEGSNQWYETQQKQPPTKQATPKSGGKSAKSPASEAGDRESLLGESDDELLDQPELPLIPPDAEDPL